MGPDKSYQFVFEYAPGGDLMDALKKYSRFSEMIVSDIMKSVHSLVMKIAYWSHNC